ncbi:MAG: TaqI-like C-terminal specificity domain-containing protein, partial [bacterium]|nr:TaqI-like C-terminal specificity domain-containing protein [bacterium]
DSNTQYPIPNLPIYQGAGGEWRLTTAERKRILLTHLYGVDIDPQAVEVTKLSLLLKVLEGENEETLERQLKFFHERALPDLGSNIKCGNSLIGPDFYDNQQMTFLDEEERYRINAFDWNAEFPEIMKSGGFDAVIGNPPYGFRQIHAPYVKAYFKRRFVAAQGSYEQHFLFYERSLSLLGRGGLHGFIAPVTWLTIPSARSLRRFMLTDYSIREISWLPDLVFPNAQVNTLVSVIERSRPGQVSVKIYTRPGFDGPPNQQRVYRQATFAAPQFSIGIFETDEDRHLVEKVARVSDPLAKLATPCSGYNPYEVGKGQDPSGRPHSRDTVKAKPYHSAERLGPEWKPEIVGRDLRRYFVNITGKRWVKYGPWFAAPRDPRNFLGRRVLLQEITGGKERRIVAAYHEGQLYHSRDVIPVKTDSSPVHPLYLLGIINSKLLTWYHGKRNPKAQKALFPKLLVSDVRTLPIRRLNLSDAAERARHDHMVELVDRMLELHKKLAAAKTAHEKTVLQREIETTDRQIDQLVYELYGLTEEEIKIVQEEAQTRKVCDPPRRIP